MKYFSHILIGLASLFIKYSTCEGVKEDVKLLKYKFKIYEKSKRQFIEFKRFDDVNKAVAFREGEFWRIYDSVEIGDTLLKELGKTDLVLIKKDTVLVFPLYCSGKLVE